MLDFNFIKKKLKHKSFPAKFEKFLRTPFLTEKPPTVAASFIWLTKNKQRLMDYYLKRADINGKTNLRNINQPKTADQVLRFENIVFKRW